MTDTSVMPTPKKPMQRASLVSALKASAAKIADLLSGDEQFGTDVEMAMEGKVEAARGPFVAWKDLCRILPKEQLDALPEPRSETGNNPAIVKDGNKILLDFYNTVADDTRQGREFKTAIETIQAVKSGKDGTKTSYKGITSQTELATLEGNIRGRLNHLRNLIKQGAALHIQLAKLREFKGILLHEKDTTGDEAIRTTMPFLIRDARVTDPDHVDEYTWCSVPTMLKFNTELARHYMENNPELSEYLALKKTLRQKKDEEEKEPRIKNFQEFHGVSAEFFAYLEATFGDNAKRAAWFKELNKDENADVIDYVFGIVELLTGNVTNKPALKSKYAERNEPDMGPIPEVHASGK